MEIMTLKQVEEMLQLKYKSIMRLIKSGELKGTKFNEREWRFKKSDVEALMK